MCQLWLVSSTCQCPEEADYGVIFPILDTGCGPITPSKRENRSDRQHGYNYIDKIVDGVQITYYG